MNDSCHANAHQQVNAYYAYKQEMQAKQFPRSFSETNVTKAPVIPTPIQQPNLFPTFQRNATHYTSMPKVPPPVPVVMNQETNTRPERGSPAPKKSNWGCCGISLR
eukprot:TRINITY_DN8354_c0_g1_i3.p1 TRINITY_DN8354_c0_g1~~TRINITY_DN8354_c0_g1_i3.p1  ORF type:complete len:106 (+),score=3.44 TRINITY_DN8354_c0_g1_i3:155-472(+)